MDFWLYGCEIPQSISAIVNIFTSQKQSPAENWLDSSSRMQASSFSFNKKPLQMVDWSCSSRKNRRPCAFSTRTGTKNLWLMSQRKTIIAADINNKHGIPMAWFSKTARTTGSRLKSRTILMLISYLEKKAVMEAATRITRESLNINRMNSLNINFRNTSFPSNTSRSAIMTFMRPKREIFLIFSSL